MADQLNIMLFSDFHYKKGTYTVSIEDMNEIFSAAKRLGADLAIQAGDLCNSYRKAPELVRAYLDNVAGLPVYGAFGNHELEDDPLESVQKLVTNQKDVVYARPDAAYYALDRSGFRLVFTDTNYSYNEEKGEWQRNTCLHRPKGNILGDSLGTDQLVWLEQQLIDAAEKGLRCIVVGHAGFSGIERFSPDTEAVQAIYRRVNAIRKGTVMLSINGHYHTNNLVVIDDVLYFDVNTVRNGHWQPVAVPHYGNEHTYSFTNYNENGEPTATYDRPIPELSQSPKTWFFSDPLYAFLTISTDGHIDVIGKETDWMYGIAPEQAYAGTMPYISSGRFFIEGT
jgi:DNA repair exonuclease SbcCD nuclease subunit